MRLDKLCGFEQQLLFHSSVGQEFRSGFAGRFWFRVSHPVIVRMLAGPAVMRRFGWHWRICFPDGFLSWLLVGGLSSSLATCRRPSSLITYTSQFVPECPWGMAAHWPQNEWSKQEEKATVPFYGLVSKVSIITSALFWEGRKLGSTFWREKDQRIGGHILKPLQHKSA